MRRIQGRPVDCNMIHSREGSGRGKMHQGCRKRQSRNLAYR